MQPNGILDQIAYEYLTKFQSIFSHIFSIAQSLFFYLAVIQLAVIAFFYVLSRDSLGDMAAGMIKKLFIVSIFLTAMNNAGTWFPLFINFFIDLGSNSGGVTSLDPSSVAGQGLSISAGILKAVGMWGFITDPIGVLLGGVSCIAVILFYGLIAAELAITLIESYCLIAFSPMFMAFGANKLTHNYAMNYFNTVIAIGVKLMVLYIIIGVGTTLGQDWAHMAESAAQNQEIMGFLVIVVAALFYFLIAKRVPAFISQIINGMSMSSGADAAAGSVLTAASVGGSAIGHTKAGMSAAGAATGGIATAGAIAAQAWSIFAKSAMGSGQTSSTMAAASGLASTAKHMGGAMKDSFKSSVQNKANQSSMYRNMANRANSLKD